MDAEDYSMFLAYGDPEEVSELTPEESRLIDEYSHMYPDLDM